MRRLAWFSFFLFATACFSDSSVEGGADTDDCEAGEQGCECFANLTCNGDLLCDASVQRCVSDDCSPGALACPCDAGQCAGDAVCEAGLCTPTQAGTTEATSGPMTSSTSATTEATDPTISTSTTTTTTTTLDPTTDADSSGGAAPPVILYFSVDGFVLAHNDDARLRATQTCASSAITLGCTQSAAVISTSAKDVIADLPIPPGSALFSASGAVVAPDFATFVATGAGAGLSLQGAGVTTAGNRDTPPQFPTGSDSVGGFGPSCGGWTDVGGTGTLGLSNAPGSGWLDGGDSGPIEIACLQGTSRSLLCACWAE